MHARAATLYTPGAHRRQGDQVLGQLLDTHVRVPGDMPMSETSHVATAVVPLHYSDAGMTLQYSDAGMTLQYSDAGMTLA